MKKLKDLKVGLKIIGGFFIVLILMLGNGYLSMLRLGGIKDTVDDLVNNLAVDQSLAERILTQIIRVRLRANRYILTNDPYDLERFQVHMDNFDLLLEEADLQIQKPERVEMLQNIEQMVADYASTFSSVKGILDTRNQTSTETLEPQGDLAEFKLSTMREIAFQTGDVKTADYAADAQVALLMMRYNVSKFTESGEDVHLQLYAEYYDSLLEAFDNLDRTLESLSQETILQEAKTAVEEYNTAFDSLKSGYAEQMGLVGTLDSIGPQVENLAGDMAVSVSQDLAAMSSDSIQMVKDTQWIVGGVLIGAVVFALILGLAISRSITRPLKAVTAISQKLSENDLPDMVFALNSMAKGDLTQRVSISSDVIHVESKDEIGLLANSFNNMVHQLNDAGKAYINMRKQFQLLVKEIMGDATEVSEASLTLKDTSDQAGLAANQIAATIQQVAQGVANQTDSITKTTHSVDQMVNAINGVALGAQEQASAVERSSEITARMSQIIDMVTRNAQEGASGAENATRTAQAGSNKVEENLRSMMNIKDKVSLSAQKVHEMGSRSEQIGMILETIDDIASQTNLLALNAAIEAARAGEHGKGFSVVAEEVRKLAERTAASTREIGSLIQEVQSSVADSIQAMEQSSTEVENGVSQANEAGTALGEIMDAVEGVRKQMEEILSGADELNSQSSELVMSMDSVSAVVEENTASTEQMSAGSSEVSKSIENIAAVSEENSASVEEVSASMEEMSAQVEEVAASANMLNDMATKLMDVVAHFQLSESFEQIELFKKAHIQWVKDLDAMLKGKKSLSVEMVHSHTTCLLGKWYESQRDTRIGSSEEFRALEEPHISMHKSCKLAVSSYNRGDEVTSRKEVEKVRKMSTEIQNLLTSLEERIKKS